jgi:hypothetical protein
MDTVQEPRGMETSSVGSRYWTAQWRKWLRTLVCVWWWAVKCGHILFKSSVDLITNPNPDYRHPIMWQYDSLHHLMTTCILKTECHKMYVLQCFQGVFIKESHCGELVHKFCFTCMAFCWILITNEPMGLRVWSPLRKLFDHKLKSQG